MKDQHFNIIETKSQMLLDNSIAAARVRTLMSEKGIFFVNVMASPGAGKTSVLTRTIEALKDRYRIGVMEADADGDTDAVTISALGVKVVQVHTGGSCHMDGYMTEDGLAALGVEDLDVIFLENVGNMVCPAEFDVGADLSLMILSSPEGDDKPLKYPLMFTISDVLLLNKMDVAEVFDFDPVKAGERARALNPDISILQVSAATGEGFTAWTDLLVSKIEEKRK